MSIRGHLCGRLFQNDLSLSCFRSSSLTRIFSGFAAVRNTGLQTDTVSIPPFPTKPDEVPFYCCLTTTDSAVCLLISNTLKPESSLWRKGLADERPIQWLPWNQGYPRTAIPPLTLSAPAGLLSDSWPRCHDVRGRFKQPSSSSLVRHMPASAGIKAMGDDSWVARE